MRPHVLYPAIAGACMAAYTFLAVAILGCMGGFDAPVPEQLVSSISSLPPALYSLISTFAGPGIALIEGWCPVLQPWGLTRQKFDHLIPTGAGMAVTVFANAVLAHVSSLLACLIYRYIRKQ